MGSILQYFVEKIELLTKRSNIRKFLMLKYYARMNICIRHVQQRSVHLFRLSVLKLLLYLVMKPKCFYSINFGAFLINFSYRLDTNHVKSEAESPCS